MLISVPYTGFGRGQRRLEEEENLGGKRLPDGTDVVGNWKSILLCSAMENSLLHR